MQIKSARALRAVVRKGEGDCGIRPRYKPSKVPKGQLAIS
jgi:hypothetical protein